MESVEYDQIIAGGGMAGLSLAHYLNESGLRDKRTLIIDREEKAENDHTWCFWSGSPSVFDEIVFHKWKKIWFHGPDERSDLLDIGAEGLEYRMIRASDLYSFVKSRLSENPAFHFVKTDIEEIRGREVVTGSGTFTAREMVFDSVSVPVYDDPRDRNLLQHFLGWVIETPEDVFDPSAATLFDFRVPQNGQCRFVYILPETTSRALVEFTVFSEDLLDPEEYERELSEYISGILGIDAFERIDTERGVIPMSDAVHETAPFPGVVRIGTAGGFVKPSTGYSFQRAQERLISLVNELENLGSVSKVPRSNGWKRLLDSAMLDVLASNAVEASLVFSRLFTRNPPGRILRFLDEKTGPIDDLRIMSTVPPVPFARAFTVSLARKLLNRFRQSNQ